MPIEKNATIARSFATSPGLARYNARNRSASLCNRFDGPVRMLGEWTTAYSRWVELGVLSAPIRAFLRMQRWPFDEGL
jgi:hypothetical protein